MTAKQGADIIVEKIFKEEDYDPEAFEKQSFPRLYLELLENKDKVIPEVRQVEYEESYVQEEIELAPVFDKADIQIKESIIQDPSPIAAEVTLQESVFKLVSREPSPLAVVPPPPLPPKLADIIPGIYRKDPPLPVKNPIDAKTLEKKQKLLMKLDILKKSSKSTKIPNFSLTSDYSEMKATYKSLVKRVHVDNKVEWMQNILLGACGIVELGLGDMGLGLDMEGFIEFQMNNMSKYDKLLIKIGEKSYQPKTINTWPVEVQLLFLVFTQTILFIMAKVFKEKTGANILGFFQAMSANKKTEHLTKPK